LISQSLFSQQIRILTEAVASPPQGGQHSWYDIEADPESSKNLIVCGMRWDAKDNAEHGFVYSSQDGGATWRTALEDKHTSWVSEESCAYGVHGVAYFIADASKIDDAGGLHHDQGTTRIYVSRDAGKTWSLGTETGWTDFSVSVVDPNPGPNQNRLYIFFNNLWTFYSSIHDQGKPANFPKFTDKVSDFDTAGNTVGLISYKDGDARAEGPFYNDTMYKLRLHGSYPSQNLLLKDGSMVTLFWSKRRIFGENGKQSGREFIFAAQHTDPQRRTLSEPAIIQQSMDAPGQKPSVCDSYLSAPATYDAAGNTIYATYLDGQNDHCTLMLAKSTDSGATWSSHPWVEKTDPRADPAKLPQREYHSLALARNRDGVMTLLWRDTGNTDCWNFAVSTDDGATYSHPRQISSCSPASDSKYRLDSASLDFYVSQARPSKPGDDAGFRIENHDNFGFNHTSGIAVTPDEVFHPAWLTHGDGQGQLRSAAVAVQKPVNGKPLQVARLGGWEDITNHVQFRYGGDQRYDASTGLLTVTAVIRNSGKETLHPPLRLEVAPSSNIGTIYPANTRAEGASQYWEVGQYLPESGLESGTVSQPIPITLHFVPDADAKPSSSVASVSVRLLAPSAPGSPSVSSANSKSPAVSSLAEP
jgi:hypothetical protein